VGKRFSRSTDGEVDVETVYAVLSGPDWAAQRAVALGDDSELVSRVETPDGGVTLVITRAVPAGGPGFLQKFLPSDPRATTSVHGVRRATWSVVLAGTPASVRGTITIEPTPTGNRHTIDGEVRVPVPLIGGKAESFIADQLVRLADAEAGVVRQVLNP
jgi:hypothetical protein